MAVIDGLEDIHVKIRSRNQPIIEYEVPTDAKPNSASNNVTKYIPAVANEEFNISLAIKSEYKHDCPTLGFNIFVDGVKVASKCCLQSKRGKVTEWELLVEGPEMGNLASGHGQVRPLKFSREAMSNGTGKITVEVQRRGEGKRVALEDIPDLYVQHAFAALKGHATPQVILLGTPRPMSEPVTFWHAPLLESSPLGVFHFKYRSGDDLRRRFAQSLRWRSERRIVHSPLWMPDELEHSIKQENLDADYTAHALEERTPRVRIKREYDDDSCNDFEGSKGSTSWMRSSSIEEELFLAIKREHQDDEVVYARKRSRTSGSIESVYNPDNFDDLMDI